MASALELGVYLVVFLGAAYTVSMLFIAQRKFLGGEFKDFINAVVAASVAFLFGSLLTLLTTAYTGTLYYSTFLVIAGFALLLTSIYFVKSAMILHKVSKVFGFAEVEKEFDQAFKLAREKSMKKKPKTSRKRIAKKARK